MSSAVEQSGRFADMKLPAMDVHVDNGDQKDDDAHAEEEPKPKQMKEDVAIEENDDDEEHEIDHKVSSCKRCKQMASQCVMDMRVI
jgi:hypothetical protein